MIHCSLSVSPVFNIFKKEALMSVCWLSCIYWASNNFKKAQSVSIIIFSFGGYDTLNFYSFTISHEYIVGLYFPIIFSFHLLHPMKPHFPKEISLPFLSCAYIHLCMYTHVHACMCMCVHVCACGICVCVCEYIYMCISIYVCVCVYVSVYIYIYMYLYVCVCVCVFMQPLPLKNYKHVCMYFYVSIGSPGTGIKDICELLCGCLESNLSHQKRAIALIP